MTILAGFAIAAALWWGLKILGKSNPGEVRRYIRYAGGLAALGVAALLGLRGRLDMALLVASGGAWLMGWEALQNMLAGRRGAKAAPTLRSVTIEMEQDRATGHLSGRVRTGPHVWRPLDGMDLGELQALREACLLRDPVGARLLEPYLDGRFPGWREDAEPDADRRRRPDAKVGAMTEQEAYQVLGLQPGADEGAIRDAHRLLMKRLHPDQGGSTYLASRVNQAKDVLLDRHR